MRQIDDDVRAALLDADGSLTADDIALKFGLTNVGATHCLQRLVRRGVATVTAETVAQTNRQSEIVLHYQIRPRATLGLPSWLDPRTLPAAVLSVRRHMLPMTECEAV